nr:MAG: hypothetical protein [Penaeus semisulcatus pemonivirus]
MKSRFKNQKCRRTAASAQIYVYKNVAIKSLDETKGDVSSPGPCLATSSDVTPLPPCSATLSGITASHPRPATIRDAYSLASDVTLSHLQDVTYTDVRGPSPTQITKRKASAKSSITRKKIFSFENSLLQVTPPASPAAEYFVSRSEYSASPAAPSVAFQQERNDGAACCSAREPPRFLADVSNSNDHLLSDNKQWLSALDEKFSP